MPDLTYLDCARCAEAAYSVDTPVGPNFTRAFYGDLASGFKGSYFSFATGTGVDIVIAFAGTEPETSEDLIADIGFGAGALGRVGTMMSAAGSAAQHFGSAGQIAGGAMRYLGAGASRLDRNGLLMLREQFRGAEELARQGMWYAQRMRGRVAVTGHSLGGGLASMIACHLGLRSVTCNAPATSQLGFALGRAQVTNIVAVNDPINATTCLGNRIGETITLRTSRVLMDAHSISSTVADLSAGNYMAVGASRVFSAGAGQRAA
ncbi:lipase family protein [Falsiroseomonas oryziterrae]|uniref:lipase family protein n=1 Tax=Falsiroseomonas oryziterrae TaxID=2911368 RepID=UPI001F353038|nr:hypothetical protein [Roseomonas sp. NPKOSM-4]